MAWWICQQHSSLRGHIQVRSLNFRLLPWSSGSYSGYASCGWWLDQENWLYKVPRCCQWRNISKLLDKSKFGVQFMLPHNFMTSVDTCEVFSLMSWECHSGLLFGAPGVDATNAISCYVKDCISRDWACMFRMVSVVCIRICDECWDFGFKFSTKGKYPIFCHIEELDYP